MSRRAGLAWLSLAAAVAASGGVNAMDVAGFAGGPFTVNVRSIKEARIATTVRQRYDFSCGAAAVATLLTYHYRDPVTEQLVFNEMFQRGDQALIRREGFSLLDMKVFLEARGYRADGIEAGLDELAAARIPAIALIRENGYVNAVVAPEPSGPIVLIRSGRLQSLNRICSPFGNGATAANPTSKATAKSSLQ